MSIRAPISSSWRSWLVDDPAGNIACVGQYKGDIASIPELVAMYQTGRISADKILTTSFHIRPVSITTPQALREVEDTVIKPLVAMRERNEIVPTDFTSLVQEWKTKFNGRAHLFDAKKPVTVTDSMTDEDGDGHTGAQELLAGTDPLDGRSVLRFSAVARTGSDLIASWDTVPGRSYVLQSATSLSGPWLDLPPTTASASGPTVRLKLPLTANGTSFYRVRVISP